MPLGPFSIESLPLDHSNRPLPNARTRQAIAKNKIYGGAYDLVSTYSESPNIGGFDKVCVKGVDGANGFYAQCMTAACYRRTAFDGSPVTCYCPVYNGESRAGAPPCTAGGSTTQGLDCVWPPACCGLRRRAAAPAAAAGTRRHQTSAAPTAHPPSRYPPPPRSLPVSSRAEDKYLVGGPVGGTTTCTANFPYLLSGVYAG